MINVYLNEQQLVLKYFKNTEVNIYNILIMTRDFNIRDSNWDLSYPCHLIHNNILTDITDSFELQLFVLV